jgi:hypothetical protein
VAWIVPVSMSKLGASLQAIVDTMPQTTTLRLCHRFRDGPLSRLPQELLEHIIDDAQRAARKDCQSGWYQDAVCWQGTCLPEDHYNFYGEEVERLWQEIFVNQQHTWIDQATLKDKTEAEKSKMVSNWVSDDPKYHHSEGTFSLHLDARFRWLDRTCLCPERYSDARKKVGSFVTLNKVSTITLLYDSFSERPRPSNRSLDSKQSYFTKSCLTPCTTFCQTLMIPRSMRIIPYATLHSQTHSRTQTWLMELLSPRNMRVAQFTPPFASLLSPPSFPSPRSSASASPEL